MSRAFFSAADLAEEVVVVDETDMALAVTGKISAHLSGRLHRAFSVFLVDGCGRTLVQQRARNKYHSGELWANSCCGHPRPGEEIIAAAERRVQEELGLRCRLKPGFTSRYRARLDGGMTENEFVHVLFGRCGLIPDLNPEEVMSVRWIEIHDLKSVVNSATECYTAWMLHYLRMHHEQIVEHALSASRS